MHKASKFVVLLVDDEPEILRALCRVLEPRFEVVTAIDYESGCRVLRERRVDLIVSDYAMPGPLDGVDLLRAAASMCPDSVRVMLSGRPPGRSAIEWLERAGILHALFVKPWVEDLPSQLESLIGRKRSPAEP